MTSGGRFPGGSTETLSRRVCSDSLVTKATTETLPLRETGRGRVLFTVASTLLFTKARHPLSVEKAEWPLGPFYFGPSLTPDGPRPVSDPTIVIPPPDFSLITQDYLVDK